MIKKVLIIGNGFDLAHGLPTRYSDFLKFAYEFERVFSLPAEAEAVDFNDDEFKELHINGYIVNELITIFQMRKNINDINSGLSIVQLDDPLLNQLHTELKNNIWFFYFWEIYKAKTIRGDNWIDFESEMSEVIQLLDNRVKNLTSDFYNYFVQLGESNNKKNKAFYNAIINAKDPDWIKRTDITKGIVGITVRQFSNQLYEDLQDLTEALEIYLSRFVENISVPQLPFIALMNPDYILSFNYTHTFQRCYNEKVKCCYIHGECRPIDYGTHGFETSFSNIVLGIDEYQDSDSRDESNRFLIFKKFVQRIRKRNNVSYYQWATTFGEQYDNSILQYKESKGYIPKDLIEVYVYGHSLDVTDRDILRLFLQPEWSAVHIYAHDSLSEGDLIENSIKIMSEDIVIEKSCLEPKKYELLSTSF